MPRRTTDLTPRAFRSALIEHGFAYLTPIDRYVDIRQKVPGQYLEPVKAGGKILRQRTLEALLRARAKIEADQALVRAAHDRRQQLALKLAPQVLPSCRADLVDAAAIAQLADDFLSRAASSDAVGFGDLIQMGWQPAQLKAFGDAARAVADRKGMVLA